MQHIRRVAVVGAGIAGKGAAWSLARAGIEVDLFESTDALGGNAKTHTWRRGDDSWVTGLSVLAWPRKYFHNYRALLGALDVASEACKPLCFMVHDGDFVWAQADPDGSSGHRRLARDIDRWERLVSYVRRVNRAFAAGPSESLYDAHPLNPMAALPLKRLFRAFGISAELWQRVFVPIHSSTFLTSKLASVPAMVAPTIEDIIPLRRGGVLDTWTRSSRDVFAPMTRDVRVHLASPVTAVERKRGEVRVTSASGEVTAVDAVVFACPAAVAVEALRAASRLEKWLLAGVRYADHEDTMFAEGVVHSDASVVPAAVRDVVLRDYANYVAVRREGDAIAYENTFVISSWAPSARGAGLPMMVSYNRAGPIAAPERRISNRFSHPSLSSRNLVRMALMRRVQGARGAFYCGSYTTPGNGHDLSLLSGLVIAEALGAPYPFAHDAAAATDFARLKRIMLGR